MRVALRHRGTGKIKYVDTGWSWSVFLSAGFFGLPLFLRGLLYGTAVVMMLLANSSGEVPFIYFRF